MEKWVKMEEKYGSEERFQIDMVIFTNVAQHIQNGINLCHVLPEIASLKSSGAARQTLPHLIQTLMMQQRGQQRQLLLPQKQSLVQDIRVRQLFLL